MSPTKTSGQGAFTFSHVEDFRRLPAAALPFESKLHGTFAVDKRPGHNELFYGMPGLGLLRVSADLTSQDLITLPPELTAPNFHSTRMGFLGGQPRLFLSVNDEARVAIVTLDGDVDYILPKPEWDVYEQAENQPFRPTDTAPLGDKLFVADGYGHGQFISHADTATRQWTGYFGGRSEDRAIHGKFGTAHGITPSPVGDHLTIADRSNWRLEMVSYDGESVASYSMPEDSRPCGIDYVNWKDHWYAVIGSLDDPQPGRPAPIYVLDVDNYAVISTIRPKEELGVELADHIHNVVWHIHNNQLYLVVQAWNPGFYFVLAQV